MRHETSTKPIAQKLHLKPGYRVALLNAPATYVAALGALPPGVELVRSLDASFDFIQLFVQQRADVDAQLPAAKQALRPKGLLWVAYPRGKALATDLNRDKLAAAVQPLGFKAVAQVAVDDVWSALRFKHA